MYAYNAGREICRRRQTQKRRKRTTISLYSAAAPYRRLEAPGGGAGKVAGELGVGGQGGGKLVKRDLSSLVGSPVAGGGVDGVAMSLVGHARTRSTSAGCLEIEVRRQRWGGWVW